MVHAMRTSLTCRPTEVHLSRLPMYKSLETSSSNYSKVRPIRYGIRASSACTGTSRALLDQCLMDGRTPLPKQVNSPTAPGRVPLFKYFHRDFRQTTILITN